MTSLEIQAVLSVLKLFCLCVLKLFCLCVLKPFCLCTLKLFCLSVLQLFYMCCCSHNQTLSLWGADVHWQMSHAD